MLCQRKIHLEKGPIPLRSSFLSEFLSILLLRWDLYSNAFNIQDFWDGARTLMGGEPTYYLLKMLLKSPQKLKKLDRVWMCFRWGGGGRGASWRWCVIKKLNLLESQKQFYGKVKKNKNINNNKTARGVPPVAQYHLLWCQWWGGGGTPVLSGVYPCPEYCTVPLHSTPVMCQGDPVLSCPGWGTPLNRHIPVKT